LTRYGGEDQKAPVVDRRQVSGNLLSLFDASMSFVTRYVDLWDARPSRRTIDEQAVATDEPSEAFVRGRANYHRGAIIEALINLLAHCDWGPRDREARVNIFDESIELLNPAPDLALPVVSLRYGVAIPPNPRLKAVITNPHYGIPPSTGGLPRLIADSRAFARRAPEGPTLVNREFRLKLFGLC
ncbi:MAG: hypothetical protein ABI882_12975, partial [Acidobacteriota bacterium]